LNVPLASTEPDLKLPQALRDGIAARLRRMQASVGRAGARRFASNQGFGRTNIGGCSSTCLRRRAGGTVFLIGGPGNAARAETLIARTAGAPGSTPAIFRSAKPRALLRLADLFVRRTRVR